MRLLLKTAILAAGKTQRLIANEAGIPENRLSSIVRAGSSRGRRNASSSRPCSISGLFEPTRSHQIHCRPSCRMAAFKAKAQRTAVPAMLEDRLLLVLFE